MSTAPLSKSVQAYIDAQPRYAWRRSVFNWVLRRVVDVLIKFDVTGQENIPASGPTILMMNHISAIDPGLCMAAVKSRFVVPMSKIENFRNPAMLPFLWFYGAYAVRRDEVDREALMNSIALLQSGMMILIAPEGTRSAEGLQEPKDGMTYVATKANAIILPTGLSGAQHFKTNFPTRRTPVQLHFGPPFRFRTNGRTRIPRAELAQMTREAMYQLALAVPDASMRGAYSDVENATTETLAFVDPATGEER
jgi:1-acyl-sn-glycerol-3-phosphate acyltransferase